MNFELFGYRFEIGLISIIEILILYTLVFLFLKFILFSKSSIQLKLSVCIFTIAVIILETLESSTHYSDTFFIKYKNLIYILFILIFLSVFQPELRHGILKIINIPKKKSDESQHNKILEILRILKEKQSGAIIVIENSINLEPYMTSYVTINANISAEILQSIFSKSSVLHDGAVIISDGKIKYAKSFFKFVDSHIYDTNIGARHRVAIYLSTQTDADIYVISEERGTISYCKNGKLQEIG